MSNLLDIVSPTTMRCENYDGEKAVVLTRGDYSITVQDGNIEKYPSVLEVESYFHITDWNFRQVSQSRQYDTADHMELWQAEMLEKGDNPCY